MSMLRTFSTTLILLAGIATTAHAQELVPQGSRSAAMGEAHTAIAEGPSAIYHNPAGIARSVMFAMDANFEYAPRQTVLNASVADSETNPALTAGVGYSYVTGREELEGLQGHDIRLGIAMPVVPDRVSLGVGGRYLLLDQDGIEALNGFTLDAGVLAKLDGGLHAGVSGQNLIDLCAKDACKSFAPTIIKGGLGFATRAGLTLSADGGVNLTTADDPKAVYGFGAEYMAVMVPIRLGFQRIEATDQSLLTGGLGFHSRAAGFNLSAQYDLSHEETTFLGSISIYL